MSETEAQKKARLAKEAKEAEDGEIIVKDPLELRPKELPLVILPPKGKEWENDAQKIYAQLLNGYAYKNPEKWNSKKAGLLEKLKSLGKNPQKLNEYQGTTGQGAKLSYSNKLMDS